jgi:16S rRNA (cytidine1402-2'-O)-methyltransferase
LPVAEARVQHGVHPQEVRVTEGTRNSIAPPDPGTLSLVATPIGNLGDLGDRAREVLRGAGLLLAEDTRHTLQLLRACGIERPPGSIESLHEHNERERVPGIVERLARGESVALASDAGTPLVSDPGALLVAAAVRAGVRVTVVPGPCAAVAALAVSALPTARFTFEGFLPPRAAARREALQRLAGDERTLVFYEAPHRLRETLEDCAAACGADRPAIVAREITKKFETIYRGTLGELAAAATSDADMTRGEAVIVVQGAAQERRADDVEADRVLRALLSELPVAQAARLAARITGRPRRELYDRAVGLRPAPV